MKSDNKPNSTTALREAIEAQPKGRHARGTIHQCPMCDPQQKRPAKLYFYEDTGSVHCFRCGAGASLHDYQTPLKTRERIRRALEGSPQAGRSLGSDAPHIAAEFGTREGGSIHDPFDWPRLHAVPCTPHSRGYAYLRGRGFSAEAIDLLHPHEAAKIPEAVVFPLRNAGETRIAGAQARSLNDTQRLRWHALPGTPKGSLVICPNHHEITSQTAVIVVVESITTALAVLTISRTAYSTAATPIIQITCGKGATARQIGMIAGQNLPTIYAYDPDATQAAAKATARHAAISDRPVAVWRWSHIDTASDLADLPLHDRARRLDDHFRDLLS